MERSTASTIPDSQLRSYSSIMKQSSVVAAVALVVVVVIPTAVLPVATVAAGLARPSKYTHQEDVRSEFVMSVGKFSVNVYKLAHMITMYYVSTSECWSVPAGSGGYEYWMVLTAKNGAGVYSTYVSTAQGIPGSESKTWKLLSFNSTN